MRRADRLFQIVQLIRGRRLTTAAFLAQRLEVSDRTIYRDVADLQRQGVPIEGEAGVGYRLGAGFDLPPLMFTQDEAAALVASARLAQSWVDPAMAKDIQTALSTLEHLLPVMVLRFEKFSRLSVGDRRRLIEKLIESKGFLRDIVRVLKVLVMFGYYTDPEVRREMGYVEVDERPRLSGVDQTPLTFPPPGVP